ncbi:MAG: circadian clock protein KaiC, partial [Gammaproteobacteria bacterium]
MQKTKMQQSVNKHPTGIRGFDAISQGGLPKGRTTLVSGTSGSAKTLFAVQFLAEGVRQDGENGVFVTFEEWPADIVQNMASMGWNISEWEQQGKWAFVDASAHPEEDAIVSGSYDLGALLARIEYAIKKVGATRVAVDSLGALFERLPDARLVRCELFRIAATLKNLGVTAVLTAERTVDQGPISRHGIEEFVADNVVILRNTLIADKRRRTIEILKFRGASHHKGEYPFAVIPCEGLVMIPLSAAGTEQETSTERVTAGSSELDEMCGGGLFRDTILLISGATGCGKTLMTTQFVARAAEQGERCLLLAFEESRQQLFRNAIGWGVDFLSMEEVGLLKVIHDYPESASLEDHLVHIRTAIDEFKPHRVAIDSLTALENVSSERAYHEFLLAVTSLLKEKQITTLCTAGASNPMSDRSVTGAHVSNITDAIILLRYVEIGGQIKRSITVLKTRGSAHDTSIREFNIDN